MILPMSKEYVGMTHFRWQRVLPLLALWAMPLPAQDITGVGDELTNRPIRIVAIVAPDYPKAPLQRKETATVDLAGRVKVDGTLEVPSLKVTGGDESFAAAVREVAPLWVFQPPLDERTCESRADELRMRVWFELDEGKPKVSVSNPASAAGASAPASGTGDILRRKTGRMPAFPGQALNKGIQGTVVAVMKVDSQGNVKNVHIRPGMFNDWFGPVTERALYTWEFDVLPDYPRGKPHICIEIPVDYKMATNPREGMQVRPRLPARVQ